MEEMNSIITSYNKEKQEIIYHTNNENNYKIVQEICRLYIGRSFMTKEIERLQHNQEVSTKWEIKLTQKNTKLKEENKRLKSIIKESREYIQDRYDGEVSTHTFDKDNVKELLEILDKVEENSK